MVYSISDLAVEAGLSYDTLYYYIREGLIKEAGVIGNGQRIFGEAELERVKRIVKFRKEGKSIEFIRAILEQEEPYVHTEYLRTGRS